MRTTTKIAHNIIKWLHLEEVVIKNKITKLIPLHKNYSSETSKHVKRNNSLFNLNISDYMQWHIWADLDDLSWEKAILQKEGEILDIGANVGAFSLKTLLNSNHEITIHSFEPNPYVFEKLQTNFNLNPAIKNNYKLNKIGLSNEKGRLNFYWNKNNSGGGSFTSNYQNTLKESIEVMTLDQYVNINKLENITFIKIDVEGYEPQVLKGAIETIKKYKPTIFIEVSPHWWKKSNYTVIEVLSIFEKLNYKFFPIIEEKEQKEATLNDLKNINHQYNLYLVSK